MVPRWPAERPVCPRADHLPGGQPGVAVDHRGGVESDIHSSVAPGQGHRSTEGEPGVGLVAGSVEHHDVPCAPAQRLDQAEVVVVASIGHVHPGVPVARVADSLRPQQADGGLHQPVPDFSGELVVEPELEHVRPEPALAVKVQVRLTVPQRVRRHVPEQQQERPPRPPPVGFAPRRHGTARRLLMDALARFPDQGRVREPHTKADVGHGEQDPVSLPRRGAHQRRDRRPADRRDVKQGAPALTDQSLVIGGQRLGVSLARGAGLAAQGDVVRVEADTETATARWDLAVRVDICRAAYHQAWPPGLAAIVPQLG